MFGPWLPDPDRLGKKRRTHLFCFIDDHSRLVPFAQFSFDEALPRTERVLKVGILRRGLPKATYVDNGMAYSTQFAAACATGLALHAGGSSASRLPPTPPRARRSGSASSPTCAPSSCPRSKPPTWPPSPTSITR